MDRKQEQQRFDQLMEKAAAAVARTKAAFGHTEPSLPRAESRNGVDEQSRNWSQEQDQKLDARLAKLQELADGYTARRREWLDAHVARLQARSDELLRTSLQTNTQRSRPQQTQQQNEAANATPAPKPPAPRRKGPPPNKNVQRRRKLMADLITAAQKAGEAEPDYRAIANHWHKHNIPLTKELALTCKTWRQALTHNAESVRKLVAADKSRHGTARPPSLTSPHA